VIVNLWIYFLEPARARARVCVCTCVNIYMYFIIQFHISFKFNILQNI